MLRAMLEPDPTERISAADALAMLPGVDKVVSALPTPGALWLPIATADAPADDSAGKGAKAKGERPAKRARGGEAKGADALSAARLCRLLGAVNSQTMADADHLWRRSSEARAHGLAGAAACALIACKISETETYSPDDVWELPGAQSDVGDGPTPELFQPPDLSPAPRPCPYHAPSPSKLPPNCPRPAPDLPRAMMRWALPDP